MNLPYRKVLSVVFLGTLVLLCLFGSIVNPFYLVVPGLAPCLLMACMARMPVESSINVKNILIANGGPDAGDPVEYNTMLAEARLIEPFIMDKPVGWKWACLVSEKSPYYYALPPDVIPYDYEPIMEIGREVPIDYVRNHDLFSVSMPVYFPRPIIEPQLVWRWT